MHNITLKPDEISVCHLIGRNRALIARASGVKDAKVGDHDGSEADVIGFMAEYAFSKVFNTFVDIGLTPRSCSADGIYKGYRYDVKSTKYKSGRLLCTTKDNPDVDVYILALVDEPNVAIVGYATKAQLRQPQNIINLGHGEGYALTQDQLRKFKPVTQ